MPNFFFSQRYLVILDLREALFDHVYQAEELGHLSCLLSDNSFHFIQVSFSSTKPKLDNFLRSDNLLYILAAIKGTENIEWKMLWPMQLICQLNLSRSINSICVSNDSWQHSCKFSIIKKPKTKPKIMGTLPILTAYNEKVLNKLPVTLY